MSSAELILHAGVIHTMDRRWRRAESLAVAGGRVVAIGSRRQVGAWKGRRTSVVEARAETAIPAFADCHTHFFRWACESGVLELAGEARPESILRRIAAAARKLERGQWLVARGWDMSLWGRRFPTAAQLDAVTFGRPARVHSRDGHSVWLNTAGLQAAGIGPATRAPAGGRILRDHRGRPTGILQEQAVSLLPDVPGHLNDRQIATALRRAVRRAHRVGITTIHSVDDARGFEWFGRLRQAGRLELRVCWAVPAGLLEKAVELGLGSGLGDELLWIGGVKIFCDGALGSQTAWMYRSYERRPGYRGVGRCIGLELRELATRAARGGLACWIHAIGDRANHEALTAIAAARRVERHRLAHRIEHAQCVRPADVLRFGRLGVVASMQPSHLPGDIGPAERYWGPACRWAFPCRSLLRAGAVLAFGSDLPVEPMDPLVGLHAAVNRQDWRGQPAGGWYPAERLSVRQALRAWTVGAAVAGGRAGQMGRLSVGMPADIALLSEDPLSVPPARLRQIRVTGTIFAGRLVFRG